ncbi:hypothetical protein ZIOFF_006678 [Zingiber officinale]|uniref:NAD(P)-binding domain-containing protein n=1 Tax=Zingiber officinale TaxID=94328 RepID=A0A8J5HYS1_ZINOF|nr:hypothetical protein ZIOFF_006678 [Zingiber officinale]
MKPRSASSIVWSRGGGMRRRDLELRNDASDIGRERSTQPGPTTHLSVASGMYHPFAYLFGLLQLLGCARPPSLPFVRRSTAKAIGGMSNGKIVCVTGGSGYIASWLVKLLLQRGYTVRASVRDPDDPKKTEHLRALDGAAERLHLFKANLLEENSFDAGIEGCDGVFHTASPFYHAVTDPQVCDCVRLSQTYLMLLVAELLEPAVKGTLNVLASCKKGSIKRVIVTSSMAAVAYNGRPRTPDVVVDDTWFSSPEVCEQDKQWYVLSKTLAEDAAWKFAKENAIDIVTINPAMVIGPLLQPTLNTSAAAILNLINAGPFFLSFSRQYFLSISGMTMGSTTYPNLSFGWVNVKDVAMAHILAFEVPSASGRYCLVERVAHYSELVRIIRELYPSLPVPEKCADDKPFVPIYQVSKEKYKSLGLDYTPIETSIKETIESLKEKNFVNF